MPSTTAKATQKAMKDWDTNDIFTKIAREKHCTFQAALTDLAF